MAEYYLSTYRGAGTSEDPYRPIGADGDFASIDLRPPGQASGRCLLVLPARNDLDGMSYLGDTVADVLPSSVRTRIGNALGLTVEGTRLAAIIAELLVSHAREDGTRWRPLRVGRDGHLRVFLGKLIYDLAPVGGGATITDNFNRADENPLVASAEGWSWSHVLNDNDLISNVVTGGAVATCVSRAQSDLASDDHYAKLQIVSYDANGRLGVNVRFASAADTSYWFRVRNSSSTGTFLLVKRVTGTDTTLETVIDTAPAGGSTMKLTVDGSSLAGFINDVSKVTATDTVITGNLRTGISFFSNVAAYGDDFEAGDGDGAPPTTAAAPDLVVRSILRNRDGMGRFPERNQKSAGVFMGNRGGITSAPRRSLGLFGNRGSRTGGTPRSNR